MCKPGGVSLTDDIAPFWLRFPRFNPDRNATFESGFARLAALMKWKPQERGEQLAKAVSSEMGFRSEDASTLEDWQMLCREVGLDSGLTSITQCRKVQPPLE